jgi:hypothetical protein
VFHSAESDSVGPRRTEVETEVVSAVRARESRLARGRFELRLRVPHEDAVSAISKLAQWVEQRSHTPSVMGSTPMLAPASQAGSRESGAAAPHRGAPAATPISRHGPRGSGSWEAATAARAPP